MTATLLIEIVLLALVAAGLAAAFRALPWPKGVLATKPLSCVLCMAFHATWICELLLAFGAGLWSHDAHALTLIRVAGATGLATFLLAQTGLFAPPLDLG